MSPISIVAILGPWSCGSTAVAGYLHRAGAHTAPPHQTTDDPRTPDSHEPRALRDALAARVERSSLRRVDNDTSFAAWFEAWLAAERERAEDRGATHLVLKQPLLALFLPELAAACTPEIVVVTRPLDAIEASRRRRGWEAIHGRNGAEAIYERIAVDTREQALSALICPFERFRTERACRSRLVDWLSLQPDEQRLGAAEAWLH